VCVIFVVVVADSLCMLKKGQSLPRLSNENNLSKLISITLAASFTSFVLINVSDLGHASV
jgi:hypothetical protein